MNLWIIFIFYFINICFSYSEGNIWVNSYTKNVNSTEQLFVHVVTRGRFGLTVISFNHPNISITGISYLESSTKRRWLQVQGNYSELFTLPLREENTSVLIHSPRTEKVFGKVLNEIETILELPTIFATNSTSIYVGKKVK